MFHFNTCLTLFLWPVLLGTENGKTSTSIKVSEINNNYLIILFCIFLTKYLIAQFIEKSEVACIAITSKKIFSAKNCLSNLSWWHDANLKIKLKKWNF